MLGRVKTLFWMDGLQVRPDQAIFIGNDRYRDIFGAQQLGMKTILVCRTQDASRPNAAEPDRIIREFAEIYAASQVIAHPLPQKL